MAGGACSECGAAVMKLLDATKHDRLREAIRTNANLAEIDEDQTEELVCVGTNTPLRLPENPSMNDKIIHDWQLYAGRYDSKTATRTAITYTNNEYGCSGPHSSDMDIACGFCMRILHVDSCESLCGCGCCVGVCESI